jgi:hypothetical protein
MVQDPEEFVFFFSHVQSMIRTTKFTDTARLTMLCRTDQSLRWNAFISKQPLYCTFCSNACDHTDVAVAVFFLMQQKLLKQSLKTNSLGRKEISKRAPAEFQMRLSHDAPLYEAADENFNEEYKLRYSRVRLISH